MVAGLRRGLQELGFNPYYESLEKEIGQKEMLIFYVLHVNELGFGEKTNVG